MNAPRGEVMECPFCGEPTMANRLADGSLVCSCTAGKTLPEPRLVPPPPKPISGHG